MPDKHACYVTGCTADQENLIEAQIEQSLLNTWFQQLPESIFFGWQLHCAAQYTECVHTYCFA